MQRELQEQAFHGEMGVGVEKQYGPDGEAVLQLHGENGSSKWRLLAQVYYSVVLVPHGTDSRTHTQLELADHCVGRQSVEAFHEALLRDAAVSPSE